MPFVLKSDPEGSIVVSEIEYDGHTEEIPYEIQANTAFLFGQLLSLVCHCDYLRPFLMKWSLLGLTGHSSTFFQDLLLFFCFSISSFAACLTSIFLISYKVTSS